MNISIKLSDDTKTDEILSLSERAKRTKNLEFSNENVYLLLHKRICQKKIDYTDQFFMYIYIILNYLILYIKKHSKI